MMAVHEFGHVLNAWLSGGTVVNVVLHPLTISRTEVEPNPRPLFVAWGGPLWGSVLPLAAWLAVRRSRFAFLAAFFAGFCLVESDAVVGLHLALMARRPDTLIARKCGPEVARQSAELARDVLDTGWPETSARRPCRDVLHPAPERELAGPQSDHEHLHAGMVHGDPSGGLKVR
jgi:hypothetical protein